MKTYNYIVKILLVSVMALAAPSAGGQESWTYISSLKMIPGGTEPVAADRWVAQGFWTGPHAFGYRLDSVQLLMAQASGEPAEFSVSLYDYNGFPGEHLRTLEGSPTPTSQGIYDYSGDNVILLPTTGYYIVVTSSQALSEGSFMWQYTAPQLQGPDKIGGWEPGHQSVSADGVTWERVGNRGLYQFAVNATPMPVPEPSAFALLGLAGLWFAGRAVRRHWTQTDQ